MVNFICLVGKTYIPEPAQNGSCRGAASTRKNTLVAVEMCSHCAPNRPRSVSNVLLYDDLWYEAKAEPNSRTIQAIVTDLRSLHNA